ncbi:hypothetical protein JK159_02305 [Weissella minor]|uniref:hypothetical protein n=1 Tax=Weissella minor TaxID=1620 RepID=UPI001BAF89A5|nr:hypothetical protein [Weissella minor]MBS0949215.1 hypothetical protein [Weissella minor]
MFNKRKHGEKKERKKFLAKYSPYAIQDTAKADVDNLRQRLEANENDPELQAYLKDNRIKKKYALQRLLYIVLLIVIIWLLGLIL